MSLVTNRNNIFKKGVIGNVRKAQEDSHDMALDTPNGDVFVVCDGMGGHVGGAKASSLAVDSIISYLKKEKYSDPLVALNGALQFANMQILGFANDYPEYKGMGTTACIVLMQGSEVWIAHVGDSRIYLYLGKEKKLHRITKDHSYVQTLVDAGTITDDEAEHHPNKNRILKALGVTQNLQPSFNPNNNPIQPKNGDIFLICSDGLSGMIPDKTIEKVLRQNSKLEDKGNLLINLAMEGETVQPGGQDNCTVELIQVDGSAWKESKYESFNPKRHTSRKSLKRIIIAAVIIVVLALVALFSWDSFVESKIRNLESKVANLKTQSTANKDKLNKATHKKKTAAETTLQQAENSLQQAQKTDSLINKDIEITERDLNKWKGRRIFNRSNSHKKTNKK